jgi:steroid 5-alpha reductase family enzyme
MKIKHAINLHKGFTCFYVVTLMAIYHNFGIAPCVYLALHGTYGLIWLLKDRIYPDRKWEEEISLSLGVITFLALGLYWLAPFLLISSQREVSAPIIAIAVSINIFGVFLHYGSDAQKYFTIQYKPGLIAEGFFTRCRNTNYLGEFLIYLSFAILAQHWLPFLVLGGFTSLVFLPNMRKKDLSLSRYPQFADYQANSGLFLPKLY